MKAVNNINETIRPELLGCDISEQVMIDQKLLKLDGTENKKNFVIYASKVVVILKIHF